MAKPGSGRRAWIGTRRRSDFGRAQILAGNGVLRIWYLRLKGFVLARRRRRFFVRFFQRLEIRHIPQVGRNDFLPFWAVAARA